MAFSPIIPADGLVGWKFLKSTYDQQKSSYMKSPDIARDLNKAQTTLGSVSSVDDLISDRANLKIVLGAFGLETDLDNKYFIRKIIESDMSDPKSLANRMSDERYKNLANSLSNLTNNGAITASGSQKIIQNFSDKSFEAAVGQQSNEMRLALNAERELGKLVGSTSSENTKWYKILGNPPIREVMQTFLRLPSSISNLDLETQKETFADKLKSRLGLEELSDFQDPKLMERLVQGYLLQSQIDTSIVASRGSVALTLLQS